MAVEVPIQGLDVRLGAEVSVTANSTAANDTVIGANTLRGEYILVPSGAALYKPTGIEWKNGTVVNGSTVAYLFTVDANPAVDTFMATVAWGQATQTGTSAVQRIGPKQLFSNLVAGGTILFAAIATASASGRYLTATITSQTNSKGVTVGNAPIIGQGGAWTSTTEGPYMKVYFKAVR